MCVFRSGRRHVPALLATTLPDVPTTLPRDATREQGVAVTIHKVCTISGSTSEDHKDHENRLANAYSFSILHYLLQWFFLPCTLYV